MASLRRRSNGLVVYPRPTSAFMWGMLGQPQPLLKGSIRGICDHSIRRPPLLSSVVGLWHSNSGVPNGTTHNSKELGDVTVISIPIAEKVVRHQSQRIGSGLYMASSPIFQDDLYDATHIKVDLCDMTNRWGGHETSTPAL